MLLLVHKHESRLAKILGVNHRLVQGMPRGVVSQLVQVHDAQSFGCAVPEQLLPEDDEGGPEGKTPDTERAATSRAATAWIASRRGSDLVDLCGGAFLASVRLRAESLRAMEYNDKVESPRSDITLPSFRSLVFMSLLIRNLFVPAAQHVLSGPRGSHSRSTKRVMRLVSMVRLWVDEARTHPSRCTVGWGRVLTPALTCKNAALSKCDPEVVRTTRAIFDGSAELIHNAYSKHPHPNPLFRECTAWAHKERETQRLLALAV